MDEIEQEWPDISSSSNDQLINEILQTPDCGDDILAPLPPPLLPISFDTPIIPSSPLAEPTPFLPRVPAPDPPVISSTGPPPPPSPASSIISVTNLHHSVTNEDLMMFLKPCGGTITNLTLTYQPTINESQAIVHFSNSSEALSSLCLNGANLKGQCVQLKLHAIEDKTRVKLLKMSANLFEIFTCISKQDIVAFQAKGGILKHANDTLSIDSSSGEANDEFIHTVVDCYIEESLAVDRHVWDLLMANESRKYQDLTGPFDANRHVDIIKSNDSPAIVFVGLKDAVKSARNHFNSYLNKHVPLNKIKLEALKKLHPRIQESLHNQYNVIATAINDHIYLDGSPTDVQRARKEVDQIVSNIILEQLPPLNPILLLSFKDYLSTVNDAVLIIEATTLINYICCKSYLVYSKVVEFCRNPLREEMKIPSVEQRLTLSKRHEDIQLISQDLLVDITVEEDKVVLQGYSIINMQGAKVKLSTILEGAKMKREIDCQPSIAKYLHHVIFDYPKEEVTKFVAALRANVTSDNGKVILEGSNEILCEDEKKLIDFIAPDSLHHVEVVFEEANCRFISQVKDNCLNKLHKELQFTYLITRHSNEGKFQRNRQRRRSSGATATEDTFGFTISIYSNNQRCFDKVHSALKAINPQSVKFPIPAKSEEFLSKRKSQLEKAHSVRIFIHKGHQPAGPTPSKSRDNTIKVEIHGIRDEEVKTCREEIEGSVLVTKKVDVTGYMAMYMQANCQDEIENLNKKCHKIYFPPSAKLSLQDMAKKCFISVIGKTSDADIVAREIKYLLEDFTVKIFLVNVPVCISSLWMKRWDSIKPELQEKYKVIIEFKVAENDLEKGPPAKPTKQQTKVVNFHVFGLCRGSVMAVSQVLETKENGQATVKKIPVNKDQQIPHPGKLAGQLGLTGSVWLHLDGNHLCVTAPSTAVEDLDKAVQCLTDHLQKTSIDTTELTYDDEFIFEMLKNNGEKILQKASETSRAKKVHINLSIKQMPNSVFTFKGTSENVQIVKGLVESAIENLKKEKSIRRLIVDSIKFPYFATDNFKSFSARMKRQHMVQIKLPTICTNTVMSSITLKPVSHRHVLQVSVVKGDILNETTDAIVNAANDQLKHIGGLALAIYKAGGASIQSESNAYVQKNGKLQVGEAVCLGPGLLQCKHIIHAVAPQWKGGSANERRYLYEAVKNVCRIASGNNLTSVSIPALGTGVYHVPVPICAAESFRAVNDFCMESVSSSLSDVRFVIIPQIVQTFLDHFQDRSSPLPGPVSTVSRLQNKSLFAHSWSWKDDTHKYIPYDPQTTAILNRQYQRNPASSCTITVNGKQYQIDFNRMVQVNLTTTFERKVRRSSLDEDETDQVRRRVPQVIKWSFINDRQQHQYYTEEESRQLELWYKSNIPAGQLVIGKFTYSFDFNAMTQRNIRTGTTRVIKRGSTAGYDDDDDDDTSSDFTSSGDTSSDEEVASTSVVVLSGPSDTIDKAFLQLQCELDNCLLTQKLPISSSSKQLEATLRKVARDNSIKVDFTPTKGGGTIAILQGVHNKCKKALTDMQASLIKHMESSSQASGVKFPPEWEHQTQSQTMQLFTVQPRTREYAHVSSKFKATMSNAISSIQRVQNKYLWEKYCHHKNMIHKKNNGNVNEMELFHGTRNNNPSSIYDSEEGFDMRFSASGMWGQANYFAVNASYSTNYAHALPSTGERQMFLAKVLTGDSTCIASNSSLRMPPEKPSYASAASDGLKLAQVRYDTVNGSTHGSIVYMTYDNHKAYPAYLITYR